MKPIDLILEQQYEDIVGLTLSELPNTEVLTEPMPPDINDQKKWEAEGCKHRLIKYDRVNSTMNIYQDISYGGVLAVDNNNKILTHLGTNHYDVNLSSEKTEFSHNGKRYILTMSELAEVKMDIIWK